MKVAVGGVPLNESPSEKEGKFPIVLILIYGLTVPSMKVPPKRKGNRYFRALSPRRFKALNESPSEKEGKSWLSKGTVSGNSALNESPSEKEGKCNSFVYKVALRLALNESPSEKEGKLRNR